MRQQARGLSEDDLVRLEERLKRPGRISRKQIARDLGWPEQETLEALRELARRRLVELAAQRALTRQELARQTARVFRRCYGQQSVERLIGSLLREGILAGLPRKRLLYRPDAPQPLLEALGLKPELRPEPPPGDLPARILAKLAELEEAPFVPVIVDRLRPAFSDLDKEQFDRTVVHLADDGRVWLVPVRVFKPEDREMLIHDGKGNYYAGVGLRR